MRMITLPQLAYATRCAMRFDASNSTLLATSKWSAAVLAASLVCVGAQPTETFAQSKGEGVVPKQRALASTRPASAASSPTGKASGQLTSSPASPQALGPTWPERLVWDKVPLRIALGVGPDRERSITFPTSMHIGVPQEVAPLLRLQTVGPTTYVTALAPFARSRVIAEDRSTGTVILLDLSAAAENTSNQPITVVAAPSGDTAATGQPEDAAQAPVDMVTLTRFAVQQMYAPRRLTVGHPGIRRVIVDAAPLKDLYAGAGLKATPAGQWRGGEFYVTAVVLQNQQAQAIELNPADVRGHWRAITFQHGRLFAKGSEADTTVAYLVCERPFNSCR